MSKDKQASKSEKNISNIQREAMNSTNVNQTHPTAIIQHWKKYDKLRVDSTKDAEVNMDYNFSSVKEDSLKAATKEILAEHLSGKKYLDLNGELLETPDLMISNSWGGSEGYVLLPTREQSALQIHTGDFIPNLMHEVGHMVKGQEDNPGMKEAIANIAKEAKEEAKKLKHAEANPSPDKWEEEVRADLTGVHIRWLAGTNPTKAEYEMLGDEPADVSHPSGKYRIARIAAYIKKLTSN